MVRQQLKDYTRSLGDLAETLYDHDSRIVAAKSGSLDSQLVQLGELFDIVAADKTAKDLIVTMSESPHAQVRELAASIIGHLWLHWKILPYDPDEDGTYHGYEQRVADHARTLSWTIPLIEKLILDKAVGPVVKSLYVIWDMEKAESGEKLRLGRSVLKILNTDSLEIKKALVQTLAYYYDDNDEARYILDEPALQFYVRATYDADEWVRDWALFKLWLSVENLNESAAEAFSDAYDRELVTSEARVEAAIGMARMGLRYDILIPDIIVNLNKDDCGKGWLDAAGMIHSEEILTPLINLYERLRAIDEKDDHLDDIEEILHDWSDDFED